jgi:hypothetical protein
MFRRACFANLSFSAGIRLFEMRDLTPLLVAQHAWATSYIDMMSRS